MLGPVSGVASAARRRARRRRRVIIVFAVLIVFVIAELVHQVLNASAPAARRTAGTWIANLAPVIVEANSLGGTFELIDVHGATMTRPQVVSTMQSLVTASSTELGEIRDGSLGPPSRIELGRLVEAMTLRSQAFVDLDAAVTSAMSGQSTAAAVTSFREALAAMRAADVAYQAFYRSLPRGSDPSQLPATSWNSPRSLWSISSLQHLATRLSQATQLLPHPHLSITAISLSPLPEVIPTTTTSTTTTTTVARHGSATTTTTVSRVRGHVTTTTTTTTTLPKVSQIPNGTAPSVFAPTTSIRPIVVVRNDGNVSESGVTVETTLNGQVERSSLSGTLVPGASRYLELGVLAVRARTMGSCHSANLRHDRCTSLVVRLTGSGQIQVQRSVALAFFVS